MTGISIRSISKFNVCKYVSNDTIKILLSQQHRGEGIQNYFFLFKRLLFTTEILRRDGDGLLAHHIAQQGK